MNSLAIAKASAHAASQAASAAAQALDAATAAAAHAADAQSAAAAIHALVVKHAPWHLEPEWWVAIGTVALAVVTTILAFYTYKLWRDAREATHDSLALSRKMYAADHRPWIQVNIVGPASDLECSDRTGGQVSINVELKNTGNTPAAKVGLWATFIPQFLVPGEEPHASLAQELESLCSQSVQATKDDRTFGSLLFPNESTKQEFTVSRGAKAFKVPAGARFSGQFYFLACSAYATTFDDTTHVKRRPSRYSGVRGRRSVWTGIEWPSAT